MKYRIIKHRDDKTFRIQECWKFLWLFPIWSDLHKVLDAYTTQVLEFKSIKAAETLINHWNEIELKRKNSPEWVTVKTLD